jgi:hypothetical protein
VDATPTKRKKHLYNSKLSKVRWFVQRFGAKELIYKPLRVAFAPLIVSRLKPRTFKFKGEDLPYVYHPYNMTWATERCVEVPIGRHFLSKTSEAASLEVGNVLSHYGPVRHEILDKFEKGQGVINEDITAFRPNKRYDLIVSISTFEHIGYDDETEGSSAEKIKAAINTCRLLLSAQGKLAITVPMGYNPELNSLIAKEDLDTDMETFLQKKGPQDWRECSRAEALQGKYKEPFPYANAIMVAEFGPSRS